MAIEALLDALTHQADLEAARRLSEAEEAAQRIISAAESEARRRLDRHAERVEREIRDRLARETAEAMRNLRRQVLDARAALLTEVFARSAARLDRLPVTVWRARIPALVAETVTYLEDREAVLECAPDAVDAVRMALPPDQRVTVKAQPGAPAGVVGRSTDGAVLVDNTLRARLDRARDHLAVRLLGRIGAG